MFWNEIAQAPHQAVADRGRGRASRDRRHLAELCRRSAGHPRRYPHQGRPGIAGVHAVLAAGAGLGDPPKPLPAPKALRPVPDIASDTTRELAPRTHPPGLGRRAARELDSPARRPAQDGSARSSKPAWPAMPPARPARSRGHVRALAASALRRDQPAAGLARRALCRGGAPCPCRRHRQVPERIGLARILPASAVRRAGSRDPQSAALFDAFPWRHDDKALRAWQRGQTGYPHRRCRDARALAHRRDAQPGADGGGVVPGQASPDRLALRRKMVLGHAGGCRRRQQSGQLAMGRGLRRRCRALFPRLQSDPAGREVRSRRRLCQALGAGNRASCRQA